MSITGWELDASMEAKSSFDTQFIKIDELDHKILSLKSDDGSDLDFTQFFIIDGQIDSEENWTGNFDRHEEFAKILSEHLTAGYITLEFYDVPNVMFGNYEQNRPFGYMIYPNRVILTKCKFIPVEIDSEVDELILKHINSL